MLVPLDIDSEQGVHLLPQCGHSKEHSMTSLKCGILVRTMVVSPCRGRKTQWTPRDVQLGWGAETECSHFAGTPCTGSPS